MDITRFIVSRRTDALLRDDYNSYSAHLSRRLLTTRRRVGRTTPKGKKYAGSSLGTSEDIARNHEYVQSIRLFEKVFNGCVGMSICGCLQQNEHGLRQCI